jgi:hypothetical protein
MATVRNEAQRDKSGRRPIDFVREYEKSLKVKSSLGITLEMSLWVGLLAAVGVAVYYASDSIVGKGFYQQGISAILAPCLMIPFILARVRTELQEEAWDMLKTGGVLGVIGVAVFFACDSITVAIIAPLMLLPFIWSLLKPKPKTKSGKSIDKKQAKLLGVKGVTSKAKAKKATAGAKEESSGSGALKRTHNGVLMRRSMHSPPSATRTPRRTDTVAYYRSSPSNHSPVFGSPGSDLLANNSPITTMGELDQHNKTWNTKPAPPAKISYALEPHQQSGHGRNWVENYEV